MCPQEVVFTRQCHIDKGLGFQEFMEDGRNVTLVIVPSQTEVLVVPSPPGIHWSWCGHGIVCLVSWISYSGWVLVSVVIIFWTRFVSRWRCWFISIGSCGLCNSDICKEVSTRILFIQLADGGQVIVSVSGRSKWLISNWSAVDDKRQDNDISAWKRKINLEIQTLCKLWFGCKFQLDIFLMKNTC